MCYPVTGELDSGVASIMIGDARFQHTGVYNYAGLALLVAENYYYSSRSKVLRRKLLSESIS